MNSTPITNDAMLMQIIGNDLRKVMDDVTQVILENIIRKTRQNTSHTVKSSRTFPLQLINTKRKEL